MIVTKIESVTKIKYKVFIEEKFAFVLYKGELSHYGIRENEEVSQEVIERIEKEVLEKRVKLRAMHLLEKMDRTQSQLTMRLQRDGYTQEMIDVAMQYVTSFGYINDAGYAERYIANRQGAKSKQELMSALLQKGISKDVIQKAIADAYQEEDERAAILKLAEKRHFCAETATEDEKRKMMGYLLRKGFRYEDIRQVIQVSSWNA